MNIKLCYLVRAVYLLIQTVEVIGSSHMADKLIYFLAFYKTLVIVLAEEKNLFRLQLLKRSSRKIG